MTPVNLIKRQLAIVAAFLHSTEQRSIFLRHLSQFFKDYGTVVVGVAITRLLTFITTAILAHKLGVEGFGAFSVAYTVITLVGQLPSCLDISFVRHYGTASSQSEKQALLRASLNIKVATFILLVIAALAFSGTFATQVFGKEELAQLLAFAVVAGGFYSVFSSGLAYYQACGRFFEYVSLPAIQSLFVFLALVAYTSFSAASALGSIKIYAIVYGVFALGIAIYFFVQSSSTSPISPKYSKLIKFSSWLILAGVCEILLQRADLLLLSRYMDYSTIGIYGAAVRVAVFFGFFTSNLSVLLLPLATEAIKRRDTIKQYLAKSYLAVLGIIVLIVAGIIGAPLLLTLTLGPDYAEATRPLRLLLIGYAFVAISSPLAFLLYGLGRGKLILGRRILELCVAVVLAVVLIPRLAGVGAALSLAAAYLVGSIFVLLSVYRCMIERQPAGNLRGNGYG
jgi:O-antigen/teichoic acid export membrane protein